MFSITCRGALFVESVPVLPRALKIVHRRFAPRTNRNALCDPQIPPDAKTQVRCNVFQCIFVKSIPVQPEPENSVLFSRPGHTGMYYVTHRSTRMRKHMFCVTCSNALFVQSVPVPPRAWNIVHRRFAPWTHLNALRDLQIPLNAKTHVQCHMSRRAICQIHIGPIWQWRIVR
jgi:hypothetical protein